MKGELGIIDIEVPRDRYKKFGPVFIHKYQREFGYKIIS
ncbi:MAG: hypothetical protein H0Z29_09900 [Candidatus Marinimicrobia bacterium]|nr:hypothetical protein [Candidatus Neomarinimicrobiota bacterium]